MKVGIVTLFGYFNYGNRLQNYAVERVFIEAGCDVATIHYEKYGKKKILKESCKAFLCRFWRLFPKNWRARCGRYAKFFAFNKKRIHVKDVYDLENLNGKYDVFICGSDQVWNPIDADEFMFLDFADPQKRVSFSASFGVDMIPEKDKAKFEYYLKKMHKISVRENSGQALVKELANRDATILLDPVMMIDAEQWELIEKEPDISVDKNFVVSYFIGEKSIEIQKDISKFVEKNHCQIIDLYNPDSRFYNCGPEEFVYYIHHAKMVFTDSFHAVAFSILFEKKFWVYARKDKEKDMSARIRTITEKFALEKRFIKNRKPEDSIDVFEDIDYAKAKNVLSDEQKKAKTFVREVLAE